MVNFRLGHEIKPVYLEETIQITAVVIFLCIQSAKKVLLLTSRGQFWVEIPHASQKQKSASRLTLTYANISTESFNHN